MTLNFASTSTDIPLHTRDQIARDASKRDRLPDLAPPDEPLAAHGFGEIMAAIRWLIAAVAVCVMTVILVWVTG